MSQEISIPPDIVEILKKMIDDIDYCQFQLGRARSNYLEEEEKFRIVIKDRTRKYELFLDTVRKRFGADDGAILDLTKNAFVNQVNLGSK